MSFTSKTKIYLAIVTALIVGLALGWAGGANQARRHHRQGFGDNFQLMKSLSHEQRQKLKEVRRSHRERMHAAMEGQRTVSQEFNEALEKGSDLTQLREIYSRLLKSREQRDWIQFEVTSKILPELQPEQLKHLRLREPRGPGGPNGPEQRHLERERNREGS
jgi:Spy/CpxP family protein refolding chaperone